MNTTDRFEMRPSIHIDDNDEHRKRILKLFEHTDRFATLDQLRDFKHVDIQSAIFINRKKRQLNKKYTTMNYRQQSQFNEYVNRLPHDNKDSYCHVSIQEQCQNHRYVKDKQRSMNHVSYACDLYSFKYN
jgi:hypothetical protein